jgi:hypothetical protein
MIGGNFMVNSSFLIRTVVFVSALHLLYAVSMTYGASGVDTTKLNVCSMFSIAEMETVMGYPMSKSIEPRPVASVGEERGCTFYDSKGHFYEVTFYPLYQWGIISKITQKSRQLQGVGDGAYLEVKSDSIDMNVLVKDKAVIEIRISEKNQRQKAIELYKLARKKLF